MVWQVYDCENPLAEIDGDAFNDPEMGEIYFANDSGILMRSLHEDEGDSPPRKRHPELHTYMQAKSHTLHGGVDDSSSIVSSVKEGHGEVSKATVVEHVIVTIILW